jgi:transposase
MPGVSTVRAAAFAAHTLPVERFPTPEHLYSATGLAPASYESASVRKRGAISRTGLPEHRDALMGIAWGLGQFAPSFQQRLAELAERGMSGIQARVALARHACRLCWALLHSQQPYDDRRYDRARRDYGR